MAKSFAFDKKDGATSNGSRAQEESTRIRISPTTLVFKDISRHIMPSNLERQHSHHYPNLEYEKGYSDDDTCHHDDEESTTASSQARDTKLALVFGLLVIFGAGNVVFGKLQAVPMYNYPNFLNLFGVALYVPICFSYVSPSLYNVKSNGFILSSLTLFSLFRSFLSPSMACSTMQSQENSLLCRNGRLQSWAVSTAWQLLCKSLHLSTYRGHF